MSGTRKSTIMRKEIDFDDLCAGKAEQGYSFNLTSLEGVTSKDEAVEKIEKHITQTLSAVQDGKTIDSKTIYVGKTSTKKIKDHNFDPVDKNTISKDLISRRLQAHIKEGRDVMVAVTVVTQEIAKSMGFTNVTTDGDTEEAPTCATLMCALQIEEKVSRKFQQQKHSCYEDPQENDAEAYLLYVAFKYLVSRHPTKSYNKRNIHSLNIAEPSSDKTVNTDTVNLKIGDGSTNVDQSRTITPKIESSKKRRRVHSTSPTLPTKKQKSKCSFEFNSIDSGAAINFASEEMKKANTGGSTEATHHVPFIGPTAVWKYDHNHGIDRTLVDHDITVNIPKGAILGEKAISIELAVTLHGPFSFPTNKRPISPILWMCPQEEIEFEEPIEVTLPHILTGLNQKQLVKMGVTFAKADHNGQFDYIKNHDKECSTKFSEIENQGFGKLQTKKCCYLCIISDQSPEVARRTGYSLSRIDEISGPSFKTHYCVLFFLKTCIKALEQQFSSPVEIHHTHFKIDEASRSSHLKIAVEGANMDKYLVTVKPKNGKIMMSKVDFWAENRPLDEMITEHDSKTYPPRIIITFRKQDSQPYNPTCVEPVTVTGCVSEGELDDDIILPLAYEHSQNTLGATVSDVSDLPARQQAHQISGQPRDQIARREVIPVVKWNLQTLHTKGVTGNGVVIAILDGGVYVDHDNIDGSKIYHPLCTSDTCFSLNYIQSPQANSKPYTQHGTAVAAIAGCLRSNDKTPAGIAPRANLIVCRVSDGINSYYVDAIRQALTELLEHKRNKQPLDIISMSFRIDCSEDIEELLSNLAREKVVCVAAAGNDGSAQHGAYFPASNCNVLSVGALTPGARVNDFTPDSGVDAYAYGEDIVVPKIDTKNDFDLEDGTSIAAPMVAGFLALLLQCVKQSYPQGTPSNIIDSIVKKYHDINFLREIFSNHWLCENRKLIRVGEFFEQFPKQHEHTISVDKHPAVELIKKYYPGFKP